MTALPRSRLLTQPRAVSDLSLRNPRGGEGGEGAED